MTAPLLVRRATPAEVPEVVAILDGAASWLIARGIDQWPHPYPAASTERACAEQRLWVGDAGGRIVATMRTVPSDPEVWGEDAVPALYVHALASRRDPGARGSGGELLRWVARTATAAGLAAVRLDCWAENGRLRGYYERAGFRHVDDVELAVGTGTSRFSRLEMALGT